MRRHMMDISKHTNGYEIKGFRALNSGALEGTIYLNGKRVLAVENSGRGGCNLYRGFEEAGTTQPLAEFRTYAAQWFGESEPEDHLVFALEDLKRIAAFAKKHGRTFSDTASDMIDDYEQYGEDGYYEYDAKFLRHISELVSEEA